MEKIAFDSLKLNEEPGIYHVIVNGVDIEVKKYLPIEKKMSLISIVISDSIDELTNLIDKVKAETLFHMYVVMSYTNLEIDSHKLIETFDILEMNGVIDKIVKAIPEIEYNYLVSCYEEAIEDYNKFRNSVPGVINQLVSGLPLALEAINTNMTNFDPSQLSEVMDLVRDLAGNKDAVANAILNGQK